MVDRPIIFSSAMIRALLDGRKTQTRRILKPKNGVTLTDFEQGEPHASGIGNWMRIGRELVQEPRFAPGERLWVRESFADLRGTGIEHRPAPSSPIQRAAYMADTSPGSAGDQARKDYGIKWKPSIHMPRWASRLTLIVESVKVERLQDISEADAEAEGCKSFGPSPGEPIEFGTPIGGAVEAFASLWAAINGADSWAANPWVAAISFRVVKSNIDAITEAAP